MSTSEFDKTEAPVGYDAFVSYSRKDYNYVKTIIDVLTNQGYRCWMDRDGIESGDMFKRVLVKAIKDSQVVLFFSSVNSNSSEWTLKEVNAAVQLKKAIIPIRLDEMPYDDSILLDLSGLDFVSTKDNEFLSRLTRALAKNCKRPVVGRATCSTMRPSGSLTSKRLGEVILCRAMTIKTMCTMFCLAACAILLLVFNKGRTPTKRIDIQNDQGQQVASIDYRDVQEVAHAMLRSLFSSGKLDRFDGGVYVIAVGKIVNDTMQQFDTDPLVSYITEELMKSGKVMVTSAMSSTADNRDDMVYAARSARGDPEFNQATVAKAGRLVAPTHSLFGKVIQREVRMDNGDKQIEYYFQLRIVEIATGLQWWQKQYLIGKRTDGGRHSW